MADTPRKGTEPRRNETSDTERDRVRSSNDRDQAAEREGLETEHNRGYDEVVGGVSEEGEDIDPDAPEADVDRDDSVTD
jgi:hypothetical protein